MYARIIPATQIGPSFGGVFLSRSCCLPFFLPILFFLNDSGSVSEPSSPHKHIWPSWLPMWDYILVCYVVLHLSLLWLRSLRPRGCAVAPVVVKQRTEGLNAGVWLYPKLGIILQVKMSSRATIENTLYFYSDPYFKLIHNLHRKTQPFEYTMQWFFVYSQRFATITTI